MGTATVCVIPSFYSGGPGVSLQPCVVCPTLGHCICCYPALCRKHPVGSGHLCLLLTFGWLNVAELTLTRLNRTALSERYCLCGHSEDSSVTLIISSCCQGLSHNKYTFVLVPHTNRSCFLFQREHAFDSDVEPHRFRSLPEMSNRSANDFTNLEVIQRSSNRSDHVLCL